MPPRDDSRRSDCPIAFGLDIFGDKWTLLVIRDIAITGKRHFREFLDSEEGIASNILADRLQRLETAGVISRRPDPENARQVIYMLTEKGIDLMPAMLELFRWGAKHGPQTSATKAMARRIQKNAETIIESLKASLK